MLTVDLADMAAFTLMVRNSCRVYSKTQGKGENENEEQMERQRDDFSRRKKGGRASAVSSGVLPTQAKANVGKLNFNKRAAYMFEAVDVRSMDNQGFIFQTCLSRAKLNKQEPRGQGNIIGH